MNFVYYDSMDRVKFARIIPLCVFMVFFFAIPQLAVAQPTLITKPTLTNASLVYDGTEQTVTLNQLSDDYSITAGEKGTDVGNSYKAIVTLVDAANTAWDDGVGNDDGTADLELSWEIVTKKITKPDPTPTTFDYDGTEKTLLNASSDYNVTDNVKTNAGNYNATVTLADKANTEWDDGSGGSGGTSDLTFLWTISKATPVCSIGPLSATEGETLADVSLGGLNTCGSVGGSFEWADLLTTLVGSVGINSFDAIFNPTENANYNTANVSINISVNATSPTATPVTTATIGIVAPVAGDPQTNATSSGTGYSVASSWNPSASSFAPSTPYTVTVTLYPSSGYELAIPGASAITINGTGGSTCTPTITANSASSLVFTCTYTTAAAPPTPITIAEIDVTAPATGNQPDPVATAPVAQTAQFDVSAVTWGTTNPSVFLGSTQYTAKVTLTAKTGYTFPATLTTATIKGNNATVTGTSAAVTLSYQFPATAPATVSSIAVTTQPAKLTYIDGDQLDLTSIEATLTKNDGTTETVTLANFSQKGITTDPVNRTPLTTSQNGTTVAVKYNSVPDAQTSALTVNAAGVSIPITDVAITVTPPMGGQPQIKIATGKTAEFEFATDPVTWSPIAATFVVNTQYTVRVNLVANPGYTFTGGLATRTINNQNATVAANTGTTAQLLYQFPATPSATVSDIAIKTQPTKLEYKYGDKLSLAGLIVTLTYSDNTIRDIPYASFGTSIKTSLSNGKTLDLSDNGPITITYSDGISQDASVNTDDIIVSNIEISTINATITGPVTGSKPKTTATATGFDGTVSFDPADDPFLPLAEYTATVMLTLKEGYELSPNGLTSVKINGKDANLLSTSGQVILSYDFPKTGAAPNAVVTQITITKQPIRFEYTHGDQLDLSGMVVELEYSDGLTDQATIADFAAKRITTNPINGATLSNTLHNNARIEVKYTFNNKNLLAYTDFNLIVQKKVFPTIVISGITVELDSTDNKKFTYVAECGEDDVNIDISQADAEIVVDGQIVQSTISKELEYGDNPLRIRATPLLNPNTGAQEYTLNVKKPYPAEQVIKIRWGNTLTVVDNSRTPYEFADYKWYRNGREIGSGRSWSAGPNGEQLSYKDNYYFEATTESGKTIRSCDIKIPRTTSQNYGILLRNNYASPNVGIDVYAPEAVSEVEIAVYSLSGKQILKQTGTYDFKVPNGLYIVAAKAKGESGKIYRYSTKVVVKK